MAQAATIRGQSRTRTTRGPNGMPTSGSGSSLSGHVRGESSTGASRIKASRVAGNPPVSGVPRRALGDKSNTASNAGHSSREASCEPGYVKPTVHARVASSELRHKAPAVAAVSRREVTAGNKLRGTTMSKSSSTPDELAEAAAAAAQAASSASSSSQPAPRRQRGNTVNGAGFRAAARPVSSSQGLPSSAQDDGMDFEETGRLASTQPVRMPSSSRLDVAGPSSSSSGQTVRPTAAKQAMELDDDDEMSEIDSEWTGSESGRRQSSSKTDADDFAGHVQAKDGLVSATTLMLDDEDDEALQAFTDAESDRLTDDDEDDDDDDLGASQEELDPDFIISLPPDLERAARQRVSEIVAQYDEEVVRPAQERKRAQRMELVAQGKLSEEAAAHEDELAIMGLEPEEVRDTSMVAEYAEEIFAYMARCERATMPNPNYMTHQNEIEWHMRAILVDWLLQVHVRYHMLPETLWIAINIIDRFLSVRMVSLAKLQLVGVTAMFVAAKYEEILAPSVDDFVYMTEHGYTKDEILKGERIILSTLEFNISSYCTPYSWVRRISKADDYDIQTRTLSKFLMEVTLHDHHFLRARPSHIAAIGMYLSKRMLGGEWTEAFVYYSGYAEEQLVAGSDLLLAKLLELGFEDNFVCRKYAHKKFLKASIFARQWALSQRMAAAAAAGGEEGAQL